MMTPWGIYMKPMRTGGLTALRFPASAQPMVSKNGSARVAPIPFRQVRRLMRKLFPIGRGGDFFQDAMIDERIAGDDPGDERLHTVAILGDGLHEMIDHDFVVAFELPAKGVGQQFLREVPRELVLPRGDDDLQFLGR